MDCLFCKIGSGDIDSHTIYEDDNVRAFLDVHPLTLGHTVVIPKRHVDTIINLPDDLVGPVFVAVKRATTIHKAALALKRREKKNPIKRVTLADLAKETKIPIARLQGITMEVIRAKAASIAD